ncbi:hypothetical protein TNCV_4046091 [Trichonephila clavipes]|nr:hypothetical protein TNCV_4046091 [Trichonephila clavipes]
MDASKDLVWGGLLYDFKKWAYQPHQFSGYVKRLGIVLSMKLRQGTGFRNSGREIGLSLCDKARTGRPQALYDEALHVAIEEDSSQTCGELARQFNTSSETVRSVFLKLWGVPPLGGVPTLQGGREHIEKSRQKDYLKKLLI